MLPSRSVLMLGLALSLPASLEAQVVSITGNVTTNTTWGPTGSVVGTTFWIKGNIAVTAGDTLIIQPGVVVKFDAARQLIISGTLLANGTVAQPVMFTSIKDDNNIAGDTNGDGTATAPGASDWAMIQFPSGGSGGSRLRHCEIRYGGYGSVGALQFISSSAILDTCVIKRSYFGVDCQGSATPTLNATSIEASTLTPVVLDFTANPAISNLVFSSSNNGYDAFGLRGGTLASNASLVRRGATVGNDAISNVTYVLLSSLTVNAGVTLNVAGGVVVKPLGGVGLAVNGTVNLNGSAAVGDTVVFTSIHDDNFGRPNDTNNNGSLSSPKANDWNRFDYNAGSSGQIAYTRMSFGSSASTQGMIEMTNVSIPVQHVVLASAAHGLALFGNAAPVINDVAIQNCSSTPILMSVTANPTLTGVSFLSNALTALGLEGEDVTSNVTLHQRTVAGFTNITYEILNGTLVMKNTAVLTLDAGLVIKNQISSGGILVEGGLVANGTALAPVVFTSERDDQYGNPLDTNGDGSTTTPTTGNWTQIHFLATTNDAQARLDHCEILYGSYGPTDGWATSLWITSAAPVVTNCHISRATYGIRVDGDAAPGISTCTIENCGAAPIVMSVQSDPTIATDNVFSTNGYNALGLLSETLSQNSRLRYRTGVGTPTFAYLPTGTITIPAGVSLAIDPKVVLKPTGSFQLFAVSGSLNIVGSDGGTGRVVITSRRDDNPNYGGDSTPLDSAAPQTGDWGYIGFKDASLDAACVIRNVLFQYAGNSATLGVINCASASPRLARLEMFENGTAFTFTGNSAASVDSVNILNCSNLPIVASLVSNPSFAHITFANNAYLAYGILGETIAQDVRTGVRAIGGYSNINYALQGDVTIAFGARWTIAPGVVLKLGRVLSDPIGTSITINGALSAIGKPDSLIIFTSSADDAFGQDVRGDGNATSPAPGHWVGITFGPTSDDAQDVMQYCRIRYGGYNTSAAVEVVSAAPKIRDCVFTRNGNNAVQVSGASSPAFERTDFDSTTTAPVALSLVSEPTFDAACRFLGNAWTALEVLPENLSQDVLWRIRPVAGRANMPFVLDGTLTAGTSVTLTMQPGVQVKFTTAGKIDIQRAFYAEGRTVPESLIVFTTIKDDFYGGDTNGDSTATAPANGNWQSVVVENSAIDAQVRFRNCVFRYGGSGSNVGALRCISSSPTVDSCLFAYNTIGVSAEGSSNPVIHGCSLFGNTSRAVYNGNTGFCIDASGNWWGAANGPSDASATVDLCGLTTNAGSGDVVDDDVDYLPFATAGLLNPLLGDVTLNGQVRAYDAAQLLRYVVSAISLTPLQKLVADVSGAGGITSYDGSLILQYVAGIIPAFPGAANATTGPDAAAARAAIARAQGHFDVRLGVPVRSGDGFDVPVQVTGDAPILAVDLTLEGLGADAVVACTPGGPEALHAENVVGGRAWLALASATPLPPGTIATLHVATADAALTPGLVAARVNEIEAISGAPAPPALPRTSSLGLPGPNPARGGIAFRLAIGTDDAGTAARVVVLDVAGRRVRTLLDAPLVAGEHPLTWDLRDEHGREVRPGMYFLRADLRSLGATRRLIVVR